MKPSSSHPVFLVGMPLFRLFPAPFGNIRPVGLLRLQALLHIATKEAFRLLSDRGKVLEVLGPKALSTAGKVAGLRFGRSGCRCCSSLVQIAWQEMLGRLTRLHLRFRRLRAYAYPWFLPLPLRSRFFLASHFYPLQFPLPNVFFEPIINGFAWLQLLLLIVFTIHLQMASF